jgi:hypothetical protein
MLSNELLQLGSFGDRVRTGSGRRQELHARRVLSVAFAHGCVERGVAARQPSIHLGDFFLVDVEPLRDFRVGGLDAHRAETRLLLAQVEE